MLEKSTTIVLYSTHDATEKKTSHKQKTQTLTNTKERERERKRMNEDEKVAWPNGESDGQSV